MGRTDQKESGLQTPLQFLKGVGPKLGEKLLKKNLSVIEDLLYFLPRSYEDRRILKNVRDLKLGEKVQFIGRIRRAYPVNFVRSRQSAFEVLLEDLDGPSSLVRLRWFYRPYQSEHFQAGHLLRVFGEVKIYRGNLQVIHPEIEALGRKLAPDVFEPQICPIYSSSEGLYQKTLRKICREALLRYGSLISEFLPQEVLDREDFPSRAGALKAVHQPELHTELSALVEMRTPAHRRLSYEELFLFCLEMSMNRKSYTEKAGHSFEKPKLFWEKFKAQLDFRFTESQKQVLREILEDMQAPRMMHRLLQGDVGSGKTVVAAAAALVCLESKMQVAFLAPTEVLAEQHFQKLGSWFENLPVEIRLLTGSTKKAERAEIAKLLQSDGSVIVVGTHALLEPWVSFKNLGLVLIDEQHRFGVLQRAKLLEKGKSPDLLVMTATPIPRSLALSLYGDLDVSQLKEKPEGRQRIQTTVFKSQDRLKLEGLVKEKLKQGQKVYWIFPLIEESEHLDLSNLEEAWPRLKKIFSEFRLDQLHGRMAGAEKLRVLRDFQGGSTQMLVSTTVVEVGVNVPEATGIVIENSERFGLSQLHQLRGRVGRGLVASDCFLIFGGQGGKKQFQRLKAMEASEDGFELAELDLKLRGPGDFRGTKQAGLPQFRVANLFSDSDLLMKAREDALNLLSRDPELKKQPELRHRLDRDLQHRFIH